MPGARKGSHRQAGEIIRQLWLHRLENDFNYPVARLAVEYPSGSALLAAAKRAVEIAIEESEAAAMKYLEEKQHIPA